MLGEAEERLCAEGAEIWLAALSPEAKKLLEHKALAQHLGHERVFFTVKQTVDAYKAWELASA
jgi:sulfate permease, SulP family